MLACHYVCISYARYVFLSPHTQLYFLQNKVGASRAEFAFGDNKETRGFLEKLLGGSAVLLRIFKWMLQTKYNSDSVRKVSLSTHRHDILINKQHGQ